MQPQVSFPVVDLWLSVCAAQSPKRRSGPRMTDTCCPRSLWARPCSCMEFFTIEVSGRVPRALVSVLRVQRTSTCRHHAFRIPLIFPTRSFPTTSDAAGVQVCASQQSFTDAQTDFATDSGPHQPSLADFTRVQCGTSREIHRLAWKSVVVAGRDRPVIYSLASP